MPTAPIVPLVPVDEYLSTNYEPDVEYIDGILVEKSRPAGPHRLLSVILLMYFRQIEKELRIKALADFRT